VTVLLLTLAGPLQAWGSTSRFTTRATDDTPTKSGVIGLLAAARGLRRTDPLEDLLTLRFGVRIDQEGSLLRDFQTARSLDGSDVMPLSTRFYRADARYVVGLEADRDLLAGLVAALDRPAFPLYLGRRSCPPSEPFAPRLHEGSLERALHDEPWTAAPWWQHRLRNDSIDLEVRIDGPASSSDDEGLVLDGPTTTQRDEPLSFDPGHRQYGWRTVRHGWVHLGDVSAHSTTPPSHDAMSALE
jgi:CRISPR system Cascade subunit CasD